MNGCKLHNYIVAQFLLFVIFKCGLKPRIFYSAFNVNKKWLEIFLKKKTTKSCAQFQCYKGRKYGTLAYQHPFIEIIKLDQIIRKRLLVLVLNKMSLCGFVGYSPANQLRHVNTINYLCNNIVFFLKDLQWVRYGFSVI